MFDSVVISQVTFSIGIFLFGIVLGVIGTFIFFWKIAMKEDDK